MSNEGLVGFICNCRVANEIIIIKAFDISTVCVFEGTLIERPMPRETNATTHHTTSTDRQKSCPELAVEHH